MRRRHRRRWELNVFWQCKITMDPKLRERAAKRAKALGLSLDAYVAQVVERDVKLGEEEALREKVMQKMKGLGYLE